MKKISALISILAMFIIATTSFGAGVPPTTGGGGDGSVQQPDARQIAWLLVSSNPTIAYGGSIWFDYLAPDMSQPIHVNGSAWIKKLGPNPNDWKFTSLWLNGEQIITPDNPQNGFPIGNGQGVISNFNFYIYGQDAQNQTTAFATFYAKTLAPMDSINFVIQPYMKHLFKPWTVPDAYDVNGIRFFLVDETGNIANEVWYQTNLRGFDIWLDPLKKYTWYIGYVQPNGVVKVIDAGGKLVYGDDPAPNGPCPLNFSYEGGVNMAELANGAYFPEGLVTMSSVVNDNQQAYVMTIDLEGDYTVIGASNFTGVVEIRRADDPNRNPLLGAPIQTLDFTGPEMWHRAQIWSGLNKVIITFTGTTTTSAGFGFYLYKGKFDPNGGGGLG